jgi:hypothetical protein
MYRRTKKNGKKNVRANEDEPLTESMVDHEEMAKR